MSADLCYVVSVLCLSYIPEPHSRLLVFFAALSPSTCIALIPLSCHNANIITGLFWFSEHAQWMNTKREAPSGRARNTYRLRRFSEVGR